MQCKEKNSDIITALCKASYILKSTVMPVWLYQTINESSGQIFFKANALIVECKYIIFMVKIIVQH